MTEVTHDAFESRARICFCRRREREYAAVFMKGTDALVDDLSIHLLWQQRVIVALTTGKSVLWLNRLSPLIKAKTRAYFYIELTTSKRVSNWQNYMHIRIVGHVVRRASSLGVVDRRGTDLPVSYSDEDRCERTKAVPCKDEFWADKNEKKIIRLGSMGRGNTRKEQEEKYMTLRMFESRNELLGSRSCSQEERERVLQQA